ncbi:MAG TPA: hypothetical protein VHA56_11780 [Mucilaginibacter sp.]|nr:hypothetical protein [Mucilaginibacter sp.]
MIAKIRHELKFGNTHYYTRISERVLKNRYRGALEKHVKNLPPLALEKDNSKLTLAILANKRNFYESVAALYSFCFWKRDLLIHYHEDGTLTGAEIDLLKRTFAGITVFKKANEDVKVQEYLSSKNLDKCASLRSHFIFSLRLFDMLIEKQTPYLLQIDSDVLFFSRPGVILNIIDSENNNGCYNLDLPNAAYTFGDDAMKEILSVPVIQRFNAGVFLHNFDDALFEFTEDILNKRPEAVNSWHLEQTIFAMYASLKGGFIALPKEYDLGRRERNAGNKIISEHYVHSTGHDFHKDFIDKLFPIYTGKNS